MTRLGEVAREVFGGEGSAVSEAGMIAIIVFVRLSHWRREDVSRLSGIMKEMVTEGELAMEMMEGGGRGAG